MKTTVCGDDNAMLKIAICDDTTEERELVEQYARRYFQKQNRPVDLETFPSMQDVLDTGTAYGLYLLDVLMPGKSGIQGAADLLKLYSNPVIVFITSSLESAVDSYRVCASGFLLKPVRWEDFEETMDRVCLQKLSQPDACLSVVVNRVPVDLPLNRIPILKTVSIRFTPPSPMAASFRSARSFLPFWNRFRNRKSFCAATRATLSTWLTFTLWRIPHSRWKTALPFPFPVLSIRKPKMPTIITACVRSGRNRSAPSRGVKGERYP